MSTENNVSTFELIWRGAIQVLLLHIIPILFIPLGLLFFFFGAASSGAFNGILLFFFLITLMYATWKTKDVYMKINRLSPKVNLFLIIGVIAFYTLLYSLFQN